MNTDNILNPHLLRQQNIDEKQKEVIVKLHLDKEALFKEFEDYEKLSNEEIHELILEVEDLEFFMQDAWGFPQNKDFHTHWRDVPHCTCSIHFQPFGKGKHYDDSCPIHTKARR